MLWSKDKFAATYKQIVKSARAAGGCSVLICVAPDCDALCAARILTVRRTAALIFHQSLPHHR
jgi:hypothetical protein